MDLASAPRPRRRSAQEAPTASSGRSQLGERTPDDRTVLRVMARQCDTCVFRPRNLMHLRPGRLRQMVDDAVRRETAIICHEGLLLAGGRLVAGPSATGAVCRGFFDRHQTQPLQIAERLGLLLEVDPLPQP